MNLLNKRLMRLGSLFVIGCGSLIATTLPAWADTSADEAILHVYSYGFVDLEGAKPSAIIVEYDQPIDGCSVGIDTYQVTNYVIEQERQNGYEKTIERDDDSIHENEGCPTRIYVNDHPATAADGGKAWGKYVVIELNTAYMLQGQNLVYTTSMMAGVTQKRPIQGERETILANSHAITNYTVKQQESPRGTRTVIHTDERYILLPQFDEAHGWKQYAIGNGAFQAKHCYSEYTGRYEDFELPYSIYVPDAKTLEAQKGKIALVIHMEHAGGNDRDPMSAITSSKAAALLAGEAIQSKHPAIVVVPQVEESRRSTNDLVATSEVNTAAWELLDSLLVQYKGIIDENRIYGTGQSMGGMLLLNMSAQRDNFFAGLALVGAQWSNNYDKPFQHNGAPARSPENDPISFNGFGLDAANYQNWYYMVSDDNILIHTCSGDPMATGEWQALVDYYAAAGVTVAQAAWDPYMDLAAQNRQDQQLTGRPNHTSGSGIYWASFTRGSHMSTWKYGYQLEAPLAWLFEQRRETAQRRGKIEQLKQPWLGRDEAGQIRSNSGTQGLNSAQFTPWGASEIYTEGWTPASVQKEAVSK